MTKKKIEVNQLSPSEMQVIEQLRAHPEMMERLQSVLDIIRNADGPLKSADEVEELLVQEMRHWGSTSMQQWALQAQERVSQELKAQDPTVRSRKKKR
jgi:hypothetical protein